ncbi:DUF4446 family protein [Clostridium vincentii]|uniref:DUF4446 domain-containing protein n=1 Tax=Clostridium vincentii TaxID=52704 RepID=A0A2T0BBX4_9CLOT|nr:DUF4446 family protein [Clostridium vincentii]PRR81400.1 hypothetical protein CLVI_25230 [Clostridium vincentii]
MESLFNNLNNYLPYILGIMALIILLLFILIVILFKAVNKVEQRYRKLMRGVSNKNLESLITSQLENIDKSNSISQETLKRCNELSKIIEKCAQKVAIIRYRAFEDVGSDLSFSIAMLDGNNDGIVLTGLYGRQQSTTYAKPIDNGISRYDLSEEEILVIKEAINNKAN